MGGGNYSMEAARTRTVIRSVAPSQTFFRQVTGCHPLMDPKSILYRESRDSVEHPRSRAIAWFLDHTNSMQNIPIDLARKTLPTFAHLALTDFPDMQVLFGAVGDATADRAPLQIGQFESNDSLMDQWLTRLYLEGGGGPYGQESFELAFYAAAYLMQLDCYEKRGEKGYLFVTGDELPYPTLSAAQVNRVFGRELLKVDVPTSQVIAQAQQQWETFFLIPDLRRAEVCRDGWRAYLGDRVIVLEDPEDAALVGAILIGLTEGSFFDLKAVMELLSAMGFDRNRASRIYRSVRPYASLIGYAGARRVVHLTTTTEVRPSQNVRSK